LARGYWENHRSTTFQGHLIQRCIHKYSFKPPETSENRDAIPSKIFGIIAQFGIPID
jgi:hypothetical protein